MYAADLLAGTVADALSGVAADTRSLWPYAASYQRGRGALCASHEWVRRFSERVRPKDLDRLFATGALSGAAATRTLACEPLRLTGAQVAGTARILTRSPRLAKRLLGTAARSVLVDRHYKRYPADWDPETFTRWRRRTARLFR
jgi:hypothetical protein